MACDTINLKPESIRQQQEALERLEKALQSGEATVAIGPSGAIAFRGWQGERAGLLDACVYRRLLAANSPGLRRQIARAEAMTGRKVNERAIAAGVHSHDGGGTWGQH